MRVCHVAPELLPVPPTKGGAIERWIRDAAVRLAAAGHEVHVVARDHGDGVAALEQDGVRYHFVRIPAAIDRGLAAVAARGLWYFAGVGRVLREIRPDIVHHHSRPAGLLLSGAGLGGARQVLSLHSMDYGWTFGYARWDRRLFRRAFRACSRVLCVSEFIRTHTLERYPEAAAAARTLYNGVEAATFHPDAATPAPGPRTILYVGRVEERKGVHVLLDAFEQTIAPADPDVRLKIVGPHSYWDPDPSAYYRTLMARCQAHPRIDLQGPTYVDEELAAIYRAAAVSVVPSVFPEALGLTSIEAQASGVPVVVSDAGGLPETVSPGASGFVFENRNAVQLGQRIVELLADEPRRLAMAATARAWAVARFSWDAIARQLEDTYAEALAAPGAGR